MSLITVLNISLTFVGREILKEVNFQIEPGDRIGQRVQWYRQPGFVQSGRLHGGWVGGEEGR